MGNSQHPMSSGWRVKIRVKNDRSCRHQYGSFENSDVLGEDECRISSNISGVYAQYILNKIHFLHQCNKSWIFADGIEEWIYF
jgi:hypothetical protein